MPKNKITKNIKTGFEIHDLKVQRNAGDLTPQVIQMCCDHLDEMVKVANATAKDFLTGKKDKRNLAPMVKELKGNPEMLAFVCKFADDYEEVLRWNKLIREKVLPPEVTLSHREVDIAMFRKICDTYQKTYTNDICFAIYFYALSRFSPKPPMKPTRKSAKKSARPTKK